MKRPFQQESVLLGIDWARDEHHVVLLDEHGKRLLDEPWKNSFEPLHAKLARLFEIVEPARCKVAIECASQLVVQLLIAHGCEVFVIDPYQSKRLRELHAPSGAKSDASDAWILARELGQRPELFKRVEPLPDEVEAIRDDARHALDLSRSACELAQRIGAQIAIYYPGFFEFTRRFALDLKQQNAHALWQSICEPSEHPVDAELVHKLFARRRPEVREQMLRILEQRQSTHGPVALNSARLRIGELFAQLALVMRHHSACLGRLEQSLDGLSQRQQVEDREANAVTTLRSFPGVGVLTCALLIGEAYREIEQGDIDAIRKKAGVAPVTVASGKSRQIIKRYRCNDYLQHAAYHWGKNSVGHSPSAKAHNEQMKARGHKPGRRYRQLCDNHLRVFGFLLANGTLYNETIRQKNTRSREAVGA
jgi:transposase